MIGTVRTKNGFKQIELTTRIETLAELELAAIGRRSVISPPSGIAPLTFRPVPAAVVFRWQGALIQRVIRRGLFLYPRPER